MENNKLRILIVDDNKDSADITAMILSFSGYESRIAGSGKEAVDEATIFQPHIIFMDIMLPDMDGRDVAFIIKDLFPEIKIICFSCYRIEEQKTSYHESAFDLYMQKDSDVYTLKSLIENYVNEKSFNYTQET